MEAFFVVWLGDVLLSRDPAVQVPSALEGLTVVFGMGTRGSLPPLSPNLYIQFKALHLENRMRNM
jgi:hypothetical protein